MVNNYFHLKQGQLPPLHSGPSPSFHHSKKRKTKIRRKDRAKALYISYHGNLQVFNENIHIYLPLFLSLYIYATKRYIKRYKRKYLGWLQ